VPIYKKSDKTDFSDYRGIALLSPSYRILTNILLSVLSSYADETDGDQLNCWIQDSHNGSNE
jgi:hypothetical protein